jgi:membrane protein implicated in regulation of membrane protease activity
MNEYLGTFPSFSIKGKAMNWLYFGLAVFGGTMLICQFVLTLLGLSGEHGSMELADDVPDSSDAHFADLPIESHHSTTLFGLISFRTLVAAATFFGLGGLAAERGGFPIPLQLLVALACGAGAMLLVHYLMSTFYGLGQSGTLQVSNAIGKTATVYIPIPSSHTGQGKVQVEIQGRIEELAARTAFGEKLKTGARVTVVGVLGTSTLEVQPLPDAPRTT